MLFPSVGCQQILGLTDCIDGVLPERKLIVVVVAAELCLSVNCCYLFFKFLFLTG